MAYIYNHLYQSAPNAVPAASLSPTSSTYLPPNTSEVVVGNLTIASGTQYYVDSGANLLIL